MLSPSIQHLKLIVSAAGGRSDVLISHLTRLLNTHKGLTACLTTLYYTMMFVHSRLTRILEMRYEKMALSIASKASASGALVPGEIMVAHIEAPQLRLTQWCAGVKSLGDATEDVRLFLRLFGLLGVYKWAKETYAKQHRDPAIKMLLWARIGACLSFQVCENLAYLVRRGVLQGERATANRAKWWAWRGRFWVAEVVLELLRLARVRQLRYNEEFGAEKVEHDVTVKSEKLKDKWWSDLYACVGWALPGIHFSFLDEEQSGVTEAWMGASGMVPGVIGLIEAWQETG
ncbi:hypothetical protein DOTSEDRAFT_123973 [Dothistroma septosporum NZE10]|uniref:Peroxisomal biogenesis factor 11 n=1 Tax=Dothistroma septosporum (strain NZE10 / CBS 128990) TaxID=675120 RepID=N1PVP3_DOTSN|nr:hypothetical protein DOTSEDRAFT_123973 [Dothistroma septosporum NZE10]